jgi:hypothetical protein
MIDADLAALIGFVAIAVGTWMAWYCFRRGE